jgi:hypothetical protein
MDMTNQIEIISKLRQRLVRLIKLGEPNPLHSTIDDGNNNRTANVEECVRRLFNNSCSVETFIQEVQRILNVTIKSNLTLFLAETIPLAQQYLQQHQYDPFSWETFKTITIQTSSSNMTRLPSLQQACFRLPPSCPQFIDLTSSLIQPNIRSDINPYQQKLISRFAQHNFYLNENAEDLFLQTLYNFLRHIIRRLRFYTEHRIDMQLLNSNTYEMTSNVREQIRFLIELNKSRNGIGSFPRTAESNDEQKCIRTRLSIIEELRQKEANETACLVLRESRSKRQKFSDKTTIPFRLLRANLQDLILVMENLPVLKRSKTLLFAYANR